MIASRFRIGVGFVPGLLLALMTCGALAQAASAAEFRGALLRAEQATDKRLASLKEEGYTAVALALERSDEASRKMDREAIGRITQAGLELHYWIEIARCEELADEHPRWMASLQGHPEWRRYFKEFPQPRSDEVVKCYPWVPILYREAFDAHLERLQRLLAEMPAAKSVFLNDLQGGPSACGCGNPVCRWTSDYGPIATATKLGDDAAARFVAQARKLTPDETKVIAVWTTECEEHDKDDDALCAGVACYQGLCWKAYARQLKPLAEEPTLGALLLYKEFGQDRPHYKVQGGWVRHALAHGFDAQLAKNGGPRIEPQRLIAVLQGWNVTPAELAAQIEQAKAAGAGGYVVAFAKIDQSWQPKLLKRK